MSGLNARGARRGGDMPAVGEQPHDSLAVAGPRRQVLAHQLVAALVGGNARRRRR